MIVPADIATIASGGVLFAASVMAWWLTRHARLRHELRFAALLFAAPAIARIVMPGFGDLALAVWFLAESLGAAALGLALFALLSRPVPAPVAVLALAAGLGLGLAGAITGEPAYAVASVILAAGVMLPLCVLRLGKKRGASLGILGTVMLLSGALSLLDGALDPACLFFAGALVSLARASRLLQARIA